MNELTKEELSIILLWGIDRAQNIGQEEFKTENHDVVYKKVQSMIDNYCEHEWRQSPRLNWLYDCIKCRKEICQKCATPFRKKDDN